MSRFSTTQRDVTLWLSGVITQIHDDSHGVNGFRRVLAELSRRGIAASEGLVRKIMREAGIFGIQPRSKKRTTIPADDVVTRPDLLKRDFTADRPGVRFVGDITYLRTGEGWLYLATVIDLFNREVVGWSMAEHMRTELIGDALTMAHTHGRIESGALFHSDRGSQYTSDEYAKLAGRFGVRLSVGRTGVSLLTGYSILDPLRRHAEHDEVRRSSGSRVQHVSHDGQGSPAARAA